MANELQTERTRVRRVPKRGAYDEKAVFEILDAGLVCHVGFVVDDQPYVIPTIYARDGSDLLIHGSSASRMLVNLADGPPVCVTVTHIDGLVLARSGFHHSVNYRSVVVLGRAELVDDLEQKRAALDAFVDRTAPDRSSQTRAPNDKELLATSVLRVPITEASAKVRTGPPIDDDEDYALPYWAGVVPLTQVRGEPIPDPKLSAGIDVPAGLRAGGPESS